MRVRAWALYGQRNGGGEMIIPFMLALAFGWGTFFGFVVIPMAIEEGKRKKSSRHETPHPRARYVVNPNNPGGPTPVPPDIKAKQDERRVSWGRKFMHTNPPPPTDPPKGSQG